jgi:prephenate dehydratase
VVIAKVDTKNGNQPIDPIDVLGQTMGSNSSTNTRPKRSIALALRNIPGAIFKMSSCFAFRNIDILKIESRPATISMQLNLPLDSRPFTQKHWDLIFYIDYEPSEEESLNAAMMTNLSEYCMWIRDLGYYQSGLMNLENKPANWSTMVDVLSC